MSTDIIFLAKNRQQFTDFSFRKLVENTDWANVQNLIVYDDGSTDGTKEWLVDRCDSLKSKMPVVLHHTDFGSPVAIMNHYLDNHTADQFAKVDNDIVVPPGWLQEMNRVLYLNHTVDILGMQPNQGPPVQGHYGERFAEEASHIGGVGIIRRRTFGRCRPSPNGRWGWTEFQQGHDYLSKAWIRPDMPTFELDRLPIEPWVSLAAEYLEKGWSRHWPKYSEGASEYWDWAFQ